MEVLVQGFALRLLVEHCSWHDFAFSRYGFDQNQSGFAVRGLEMEVSVQGFAIRALVLPSDCKLSMVAGMVLLSRGMVLSKTNLVLLSGGSRWRFWHKVLLLELWFCPQIGS